MVQLQWTGDYIAIILCCTVCAMSSMNVVTAPSISLEGKNIWLIQSLPVTGWQVLLSKLKLHMIVTAPAAVLVTIVAEIITKPSLIMSVLVVIIQIVFIFLFGLVGLMFNLKWHNLDWTNESFAVKQSLSVVLTMFTPWGILIVLGTLFYFICDYIAIELFLGICLVIMVGIATVLMKWLKTRGAKKFETL